VNDAGEVEGMPEALDRVLDRYPWLADDPVTSSEDERTSSRKG
jgi:hypothetical protein